MKPALTITDIGCEEQLVEYGLGRFYWTPSTGKLRYHGQSTSTAVIKTKRDLVAWLVARKAKFK